MQSLIPTYELTSLAARPEQAAGIFFGADQPVPGRPRVRIDIPYRSNYYKIGVCLRGRAQLKVNLETFDVAPGSLVLASPHIIKQWLAMSADYHAASVFFIRDFLAATGFDPAQLTCLTPGARPVVALLPAPAQALAASLQALRAKAPALGAYRTEILQNLLKALLYEVAAAYEAQPTAGGGTATRGGQLLSQFKDLVHSHYLTERGLDFYASRLCITPKHLTETVKKLTGRTASAWIAETVVLEAKVLLHDPTRSVGQVANQLHFPDQSAFGRFFRNCTGFSPLAYRNSLY